MRSNPRPAAIWAFILLSLTLAACGTPPGSASAPNGVRPLGTPELTIGQATQAAAQTQQNISAGDQAVATAEIMRANAQATLRAVSSTLGAALTQAANRQTQMAGVATTGAQTLLIQQNNDELAAGTQTAVANNIATQTQAALATSEWYADQARQREEQRQAPIAFVWTWCVPIFAVLFAGLGLWGFWRWLKIQQDRQRISGGPTAVRPAPVAPSAPQDTALPPEAEIADSPYRRTPPDEQMRGWLDEIKGKLLDRDKDNDVNPDS